MATQPDTTPARRFNGAHTAYQTAAAMRDLARADDEIDAIENMVWPFFNQMIEAPAETVADIHAKLASILREADGGLIASEDIACVARDFEALAGRVAQ